MEEGEEERDKGNIADQMGFLAPLCKVSLCIRPLSCLFLSFLLNSLCVMMFHEIILGIIIILTSPSFSSFLVTHSLTHLLTNFTAPQHNASIESNNISRQLTEMSSK